MYDSSVLNIYFVANFDEIYITSNNGIKPYAAIISKTYFAYNSSAFAWKVMEYSKYSAVIVYSY